MLKTLTLKVVAAAVMGSGLLALGTTPAYASVDEGMTLLKAQKYADAMQVFKVEAARDNTEALYMIGEMLARGLGQKPAPLEATYWWEKGAYLGDEKCILTVSEAYRTGFGVRVDPRQALVWDRQAAKLGSAVAYKNLGDYFVKGFGVEKDTTEAAKWYVRSAAKGHPAGEVALATLLRDGEGVEKDAVSAWVLFNAAANPVAGVEPDRNAAAEARLLGHTLSESDLKRAQSTKAADVVAKVADALKVNLAEKMPK